MIELPEDELFRKSTMTFGEHLGELRACLLKAIYGLIVGFIVGLMVGEHVVSFIQRPLSIALTTYYQQESISRVQAELAKLKTAGRTLPLSPDEVKRRVEEEHLLADEVYVDPGQMLQELKAACPERFENIPPFPSAQGDKGKMIRLFLWHRSADDPRLLSKGMSVFEGFGVYVKASLLVGVLMASPWIFYQIWNFVAAGLYPHERRYVHAYLPFSIGLFLFGAALAFYVVFGPVLDFLLSYNRSMNIGVEPRINEWLSFVWILPVGFGLSF
jgi:sec-independent protein translocase protein TatC